MQSCKYLLLFGTGLLMSNLALAAKKCEEITKSNDKQKVVANFGICGIIDINIIWAIWEIALLIYDLLKKFSKLVLDLMLSSLKLLVNY